MEAEDVTETLNLALQASDLDQVRVVHRPRLLSEPILKELESSESLVISVIASGAKEPYASSEPSIHIFD